MMQSAYRELAPAAPSREHMGKVGVAKPRGTAAHCPAVPWHQSVTSMWVPEDAGGWGGGAGAPSDFPLPLLPSTNIY